ncbi:hypothetical protein [Pseudomonas phage vB_PaeM_RP7]|nr:MAG: hypothetical protein [Pseudomonas phage RP4]WAB56833.1 hypothetical protein [Pseudomonas phage vB_PaeM_RP15]WAB56947.1 hypothetical protein [Pseudomonas phage vB_PaeM_RP6]WAB57144.1 hypothetical protein [Pseudomonas phage vB_PaeM_RP7]WAB57281.1 hypothetical protein [Pseudomonas phage vB_PaeM_RP8]WAB57459.1 hypothetical protein [Pseudomonas phage vB_PaeM_RP9]WAB57574.1 hypothetical protein [Pseudomonas phage vB_PaeM_RP10]WAB57863.1 hypothetical protein [Pseudomonas phage vB_PaeM_RP11]
MNKVPDRFSQPGVRYSTDFHRAPKVLDRFLQRQVSKELSSFPHQVARPLGLL